MTSRSNLREVAHPSDAMTEWRAIRAEQARILRVGASLVSPRDQKALQDYLVELTDRLHMLENDFPARVAPRTIGDLAISSHIRRSEVTACHQIS